MASRQASRTRVRELAHRAGSDVDVTLLWRPHDNALTLRLVEASTGVVFELLVPPEDALDAFYHPYAYVFGGLVENQPESLAA